MLLIVLFSSIFAAASLNTTVDEPICAINSRLAENNCCIFRFQSDYQIPQLATREPPSAYFKRMDSCMRVQHLGVPGMYRKDDIAFLPCNTSASKGSYFVDEWSHSHKDISTICSPERA